MSDRFVQVQIYNTAGTSVQYDNKVDTNWGISVNTMKLESMIMDSELKFGDVYSTIFETQIYGLDFDLSKRKVKVIMWEGSSDTTLFTGFINSSRTDYISSYRDLIAYDWFFENRSANVATFWNAYWNTHTTSTLKALRDALLTYVQTSIDTNFTYVTPSAMTNDNLVISNPLVNQVSVFNLDELLRLICELQLCCPHINGNGALEFLKLKDVATSLTTSDFESGNSFFEDFTTYEITGVSIYDSDCELAQLVGTDTNPYPISGNVFLLAMDATALTSVGNTLLAELEDIQYVPINLSMIISDYTITLGDYFSTPKGNFYAFGNRLYGSQLINQNIYANAQDALLSNNITFHNSEIIQGNKTAKIYHDIDQLQVNYTDMSRTLTNNYYTKSEMETQLTITAEGVKSYVTANFTSTSDASAESTRINSLLQQLAEEFVFKVWADTSGQHMAMVKLGVDPSTISSYIQLEADNINMTANDIFNILSGNVLNLGARNITIQSDNFTVDSNGNLIANNAQIAGLINVGSGGSLGNFSVNSDGSIIADMAGYQAVFDNDVLELINTVTGQYLRMSYEGIFLYDQTGQSIKSSYFVRGGTSYLEIDDLQADTVNAQQVDAISVNATQINANGIKVNNEDVLTEGLTGVYTGTFNEGVLQIPLVAIGLETIPSAMILTPRTGGAILLNYMYSESESYGGIVIWGSDSSSWNVEAGGWLHQVEVTFGYLIIP